MSRTTSDRDREILAEINAPKIAELRPLVGMSPNWRTVFTTEASALRVRANGLPTNDEARTDLLGWAFAHDYLVETVA